MKFIKRGLLILLCATFLASCGTTKGAVQNDTVKNEKTVKADKKSEKEQKKGEKTKEKNKKKTAKSKKAKSGVYLAAINEAVNAGNYDEAYSLLSEETNRNSLGSDDIYKIDAGMIKLYAGIKAEAEMDKRSKEYKAEAVNHLNDVADVYKLLDKYYNADKVELSTLLLDSYSTDYKTYDYEDMYAVIFNALAKMDNSETADDAFQDLKKIEDMLKAMDQYKNKLIEKIDEASPSDSKAPEAAGVVFSNSALANYLALIYNKYTYRDGDQRKLLYDEMEKAYEQESYKDKTKYEATLAAVKKEKEDVPNGMARLNVVALMGLMAEKKGVSEEMTTPINAIVKGLSKVPAVQQLGVPLDEITSILTSGPLDRKMQYDYTVLEPRDYKVKTCEIKIGDKAVTLDLIENVNDISRACMEKNIVLDTKRSKFRSTTRYIAAAATYVGAMYKAKDMNALAKKGAEMAAGKALDNKLDEIDENDNPDIRGTHFFPAEVHAGALEIAPEKYNVTISFFSSPDPSPNTLIKSVTIPDVEIKAGELNLLTVQCQE